MKLACSESCSRSRSVTYRLAGLRGPGGASSGRNVRGAANAGRPKRAGAWNAWAQSVSEPQIRRQILCESGARERAGGVQRRAEQRVHVVPVDAPELERPAG